MSEGWLPNGKPDPNYKGQIWNTEGIEIRIRERSDYENHGTDKYGNILGPRKHRKKITNYTKPKNRKKKR